MLHPQPSGDVEAVHASQGEINEDGIVRPNTEMRLHLCRTRSMDSLETHVGEVLDNGSGDRVVRVDNQHTHSGSPMNHHSVFAPVREKPTGYDVA